jgi:hypothetical protein
MPNVNDVYRLTVVSAVGADPILMTFYYRISALGAGDEKAALASAFDTGPAGPMPSIAGACPSAQAFTGFIVQAVKPVGTASPQPTANGAGTLAAAYIPLQCACVITRKTATPGRGGRGRLFLGAIPQIQLSATDPSRVLGVVQQAVAAKMLNALTSGGWSFTPVLWKRKSNLSLDLTGTNVNLVVKTRRSRSEGTRFHRRRRHTVGSI